MLLLFLVIYRAPELSLVLLQLPSSRSLWIQYSVMALYPTKMRIISKWLNAYILVHIQMEYCTYLNIVDL